METFDTCILHLFIRVAATGARGWFLLGLILGCSFAQDSRLFGTVTDPDNKVIRDAIVELRKQDSPIAQTRTDSRGLFYFTAVDPGDYVLRVNVHGFASVDRSVSLHSSKEQMDVRMGRLAGQYQSIVITGKTVEPAIDLRNSEVFNRTLFTRDDQVLQQLNAGINAGQHEGGGKSLEIRRFGFNLDHGGTNGGLKILVDDVGQNQGTQGHGQGYLGSLKALSPELISEVTIINGPFSAEYGDFSGLGVVYIKQRESLPDEITARLQVGSFDTGRAFLAWSPVSNRVDSYLAYEGSYTDGPFENPLRYRRDNVNSNYTKTLGDAEKLGFRFLFGRNSFYSSGQIPLDLVSTGALNRFGYIDPTDGGRVQFGTLSSYYSKTLRNGDSFRADGFLGRSLFDLYSNFTYFLNDPVHGDAFQQHDSRLQEGANVQYVHFSQEKDKASSFIAGANLHDNQINVGLYPRENRVPTGVSTRSHAHVTNEAVYAEESVSLFENRLLLGAGIRFDEFRYNLQNRVQPGASGIQFAGKWQGKGNAAFSPSRQLPLTFHVNYGRGINSVDARAVVQRPDQPRVATTDFYQTGISFNWIRVSASADAFLIDHSHEQVYIPDDGSFEFKGPSRAYGYEAKASFALTRYLALNGGVTKTGNAFYKGGDHRVYVDSAPHFVANAALTLADWRGWSGSLRMRAINHYRLDEENPTIVASGATVFDFGMAKRVSRIAELNFSIDNVTNRDFYETQNYFESRVAPEAPIVGRIHGTPGYPVTAIAGITLHFRTK